MTRRLTPENRAELERRMLGKVSAIKDPVVRKHYHQAISRRLKDLFWRDDRGHIDFYDVAVPKEQSLSIEKLILKIEGQHQSGNWQVPTPEELHTKELEAYYYSVQLPYKEHRGKWPLRLMDLTPEQKAKWDSPWCAITIEQIEAWFT